MGFWLAYGLTRAAGDLLKHELADQTPRDDDYLLPDERARQAACAALTRELGTEAEGVQVLVLSGVLTLSGKVPSEAVKARAAEICARVRGVIKVENSLQLA